MKVTNLFLLIIYTNSSFGKIIKLYEDSSKSLQQNQSPAVPAAPVPVIPMESLLGKVPKKPQDSIISFPKQKVYDINEKSNLLIQSEKEIKLIEDLPKNSKSEEKVKKLSWWKILAGSFEDLSKKLQKSEFPVFENSPVQANSFEKIHNIPTSPSPPTPDQGAVAAENAEIPIVSVSRHMKEIDKIWENIQGAAKSVTEKIINLQMKKIISPYEDVGHASNISSLDNYYYFIKHDNDRNGKLDGHELRNMYIELESINKNNNNKKLSDFDELIEIVLEDDDINYDGMIDWLEYLKWQEKYFIQKVNYSLNEKVKVKLF